MDNERIQQLMAIMQRLHKNNQQMKLHIGIPHSEYSVLLHLACVEKADEGVSIGDISEHIQISKPAVSQIVNALEDKGLVARIGTKMDRRVVFVTLTPEGVALVNKTRNLLSERLVAVFDKMGEADAGTFLMLLDRFSRAMGDV